MRDVSYGAIGSMSFDAKVALPVGLSGVGAGSGGCYFFLGTS